MMRVAVVHYHLRSGGVTRVIERALSAAQGTTKFVLLSGGRPSPGFAFSDKVRLVPALRYDEPEPPATRPQDLAASLMEEARTALGADPDVWHFHNHSLGKNCSLAEAIGLISSRNKVLLQIHDFAEDWRLGLFRNLLDRVGNGNLSVLGRRLYPLCRHVHYAVINMRDYRMLASAGAPAGNLHLLSNPVVLAAPPADRDLRCPAEYDRLFVYPTRAIRRKNIGEFLLWSAVAGQGDRFAVTLAPENPAELPYYNDWVKFADAMSLPVEFELGSRSGQSLDVLLKSSCGAVTTSVAEGFGLAFLEPWLLNRPVLGRRLPEITREFEDAGIDLSCLYERLMLPIGRDDKELLFRKIRVALESAHSACGLPLAPGSAELALKASMDDNSVDFGRLDEELQRKMIRRVKGSASLKDKLQPDRLMPAMDWQCATGSNITAIRKNFSLKRYGERLTGVYRQAADSEVEPVSDNLDINKLLDGFLAPERFCLLRSQGTKS